MNKKITFKGLVLLNLLVSLISFATVISPFGFLGNPALVKNDGTALIKFSIFADAQFSQNLLNLPNLNAFLNEEEMIISPNTMQAAIQNGIKISLPANVGIYAHFNLFGLLRFVPYLGVDGSISLHLPKTIAQILFDNQPNIGQTLESSVTNFAKANIKASIGSQIHLGDFFVDVSMFAPIVYNAQSGTYANARYTSSASPAQANIEFNATVKFLSSLDPSRLVEPQRLEDILANLEAIMENSGINLGLGFGNNNFGIALKDITIQPARAITALDISAYAGFTYSGQATELTYESTSSFHGPEPSQLAQPVEISDSPKISAYFKNDGFLMWGITGTYALDGNWAAKVYGGFNVGLLKLYYILGAYPIYFSHTVGIGLNLGLINGDLQLTLSSPDINPLGISEGTSTPGFGVVFRFAGGI